MTNVSAVFEIRTGEKNVFFTLWNVRVGAGIGMVSESYICNLSTDENEALAKATDYVNRYRARVGETDTFKVILAGVIGDETYKRRGRLSARDSQSIDTIESGVFPFGKHAGTRIVDAPASYVLFFADKLREEQNPVMAALSGACLGVALEKGYIAARDEARAAQREIDLVSQFVGNIGERIEFTATVVSAYEKPATDWSDAYFINKLRDDAGNLYVYFGKCLAIRGATIKVRATVKRHVERDGIKSTTINRPKIG